MAFGDLSTTLQNVMLVNMDFFIKFVFILLSVLLCISYIKNFKPRRNSPFFAVKMVRGALYYMFYTYLVVSPLTLLLLYPGVDVGIILEFVILVYTIIFIVMAIIIFANIPFYGANFLWDMIGHDNDFKEMNKGFNQKFGGKSN